MEISLDNFSPHIRFIGTPEKLPLVTAGAGTYIVKGNIPEPNIVISHALIGSYSSIGGTINFLTAMNHDTHSVTTYPFSDILNELPEKYSHIRRREGFNQRRQIIIGNDVWIGKNVTLLGGIRIGTGAVIGVNATVTKDVPPYAVAAGNPARFVKYRFEPEIIRKLLAIKWWNWDRDKILDNYDLLKDPRTFVERFYSPELEIYPRNEVGNHLRNLKSQGIKIFSSILDFDSKFPLWKKVMEDFSKSRLSNATLICYADKNLTDEQFQEAVNFSNQLNANIIVSDISTDALRESNVFITTREFNSMQALDFLPHDIEERFALDDIVFY